MCNCFVLLWDPLVDGCFAGHIQVVPCPALLVEDDVAEKVGLDNGDADGEKVFHDIWAGCEMLLNDFVAPGICDELGVECWIVLNTRIGKVSKLVV